MRELAASSRLQLKPATWRAWGVAILLVATLPAGQPSRRERRQAEATSAAVAPSSPHPAPTPITGSPAPAPDPCDVLPDRGDPDQCSQGMVTCPDSLNLSRQATGLFFLNPSLSCEVGLVVSWHTCTYFTMEMPGASYRLFAGIYTRVDDSYVLKSPPERIEINRLSVNSSFGCESRDEDIPLEVQQGDVIGLVVLDNCRSRMGVCPAQPFLDSAPNVNLTYAPNVTGLADSVHHTELRTTQIGLNFMVSISASPQPTDNPTTSGSIPTRVVIIVVVVTALVLFVLAITALFVVLFIHYTRSKRRHSLSLDAASSTAEPRQQFHGDYFLLQKEDRSLSGSRRDRAVREPYSLSMLRDGPRRQREESFILMSHRDSVLKPDTDYHYAMAYVEGETYWAPAGLEEELQEQLRRLDIRDIQSDELTVGEYLGSGQFGTVNRGVWHTPEEEEEEVAVKSLSVGSSEDERVKFLQEAAIMGQFKHPNIIKIIGIHLEEPVMIVCELMQKGDLIHHLILVRPVDDGDSVPPELPAILLSFCRQVAAGMSYLSHKGFIHRDLAARNILLSHDCVCKIADFGLSRALQDEEFYTSHGGKIPVKWTAPEALNYRQYSTASDVWSYGVLLYEIWSLGEKPYGRCSNTEVLRRVSSGFRQAPPPGCPKSLYQLMMRCWHPNSEARPKFAEILLDLQKPDFKLLQWDSTDAPAPAARRLGGSAESASELYKDLQSIYADTS